MLPIIQHTLIVYLIISADIADRHMAYSNEIIDDLGNRFSQIDDDRVVVIIVRGRIKEDDVPKADRKTVQVLFLKPSNRNHAVERLAGPISAIRISLWL